VNLSVGLAYVHWALKRQAENRQYMLTQGLHYLFRYYELRLRSTVPEERQEAHFNMARTYHLLGLQPLAVKFYEKVLEEGQQRGPERDDSAPPEGLAIEAAYNLRAYHLLSGNQEAAMRVARKWLKI